MPAYKDQKTNKWFCQFYYQDYTGERKRKLKRGFNLKKDALEWERLFKMEQAGESNMSFESLYQLYMDNMRIRLKPRTVDLKEKLFKTHILPYFQKKQINNIKSHDIMKWHQQLTEANSKQSKEPLKPSYLKTIHNQMNAIMNFAMKHYGLKQNPCKIAGSIGTMKTQKIYIWTLEEYQRFIQEIKNPLHHLAFNILYWSGLRKGELFALTPSDFTPDSVLHITKTFYRRNNKDVIDTPKTPKSVRDVTMPKFILEEFNSFIKTIYGIKSDTLIFSTCSTYLRRALISGAEKAGLNPIRIHDLRHSHASLLIEMGTSIVAISERLGHENVQTTLNTYDHLYPTAQKNISDNLEKQYQNSINNKINTL